MIDISKVKVCIVCEVLFIPKKYYYNTCQHCFNKNYSICDATEADIY